MKYLTLNLLCIFSVLYVPVGMADDDVSEHCQGAIYRQFDFWLGEWTITNAYDQLVGDNSISRGQKGCALIENWIGAAGDTGLSISFYDKNIGKWRQTWIDDRGSALYLRGSLVEGIMRLRGEKINALGHVIEHHEMSYESLEKNSIKQHWRMSKDQKKTWETKYTGFYKKRL